MQQTLTKNETPLRWLLIAGFVNSFALSFVWPLTTIYLHDDLHKSLIMIGNILLVNSFAAVFGNLLGGRLFDKFSPYHLFIASIIGMMLTQLTLVFFHGWPAYPILLIAQGFFSGLISTMINSYGTNVKQRDGRYVFNMLYFTSNFGMVFGTLVVGYLFKINVALLFLLAFVVYVGLLFLATKQFNIKIERTTTVRNKKDVKVPRVNAIIIYTFLASLVVIWIMYAQWLGNLSVYMTSLGFSMSQYSVLWSINGVLIAAVQLILNFTNATERRGMMFVQIFGGFIFIAGSFLVLSHSIHYVGFIVAMAVITIGEATAFPMIPALVNELSPYEKKGYFQGVAGSASGLGRAFGPLMGGIVIQSAGYRPLFLLGVYVVAFVLVATLIIWAIYYKRTVKY
ncbi:MFS transporter [Periweissella cryptocerci]|uniref:MFS transporter n=1 Tax=Periweissella cryptocerci TaxID=2506420 RepID=A0A4P6YRA8_9LACO|nr:MFS transporter [Periweissella cryptocerci]QBO35168.1 MFS transporter [Periweissella cryptocerci]